LTSRHYLGGALADVHGRLPLELDVVGKECVDHLIRDYLHRNGKRLHPLLSALSGLDQFRRVVDMGV
jgi:hypothetical protein